ncbi:unnamed protein product [Spirodela intermedia]|uniref:Uncharacterized protein n=1 Tax=Spirodela intermedia TaxID=51605 RepID=A0A7I8IZM8_SPIIN|nr:unnamed protein product [Spirodela intermedia]CAA6663337.1 unnamed protein product [Spirodela intermedia]
MGIFILRGVMDTLITSYLCLFHQSSLYTSKPPLSTISRNKARWKNGDFVALRRLSPDEEELDGGGARVKSFILRSMQQEEALHRIWYALRRWRLISWRIVLFPTTACSSINQRSFTRWICDPLSRIIQKF